jgi:Flp pilus assembly protein CpaB
VLRRWSRSSRLYLAVAVGLALVVGFRIQAYAEQARSATESLGRPVPVLVTTARVPRGSTVSPTEVRVSLVPKTYAPAGALQSIAQAAGRVALTDLAPGEAVTDTRLARVRAGPVASLVPPGLRAFAVPTSLPPQSVRPGDHVDILATFGSGQPYTETVVEGVEVLFVLTESPGGAGGDGLGLDVAAAGASAGTTLIVLVAPEQQERLAFARAFASLEVAIAPAEQVPIPDIDEGPPEPG